MIGINDLLNFLSLLVTTTKTMPTNKPKTMGIIIWSTLPFYSIYFLFINIIQKNVTSRACSQQREKIKSKDINSERSLFSLMQERQKNL